MSRIRKRRARTISADRAWLERREDVIVYHPDLVTADEFWHREPDVPDPLRRPAHRRWLMAERPEDIDLLRTEYAAHIAARRDWLDTHGRIV